MQDILDKLTSGFESINKDIHGIKKETQGIKNEIQGIKNEIQGINKKLARLEDSSGNINEKLLRSEMTRMFGENFSKQYTINRG
jgi:predicted  nucleic acid-binding Zn-ribbon protein